MFQTLPSVNFVAAKTFVIDSCDQIVASVLKEYGWKQISKSSNSWNLKWTWKTTPKQFQALQNGQIINHFKGSDELSTKLGLSLLYKRNPAVMECGRSFTNFYPRSFNLNTQKQQFVRNFIETGVFNLLKKIVVCLQIFHKDQYFLAQKLKLQYRNKEAKQILHEVFYNQNQGLRQKSTDNNKLKINGKLFVRLLFFLENIFSLECHFQFQTQELVQLCEYSRKQIPFQQQQSISGQQISPSSLSLALLLRYHQKCIKNVVGFYQDGFSNIWVIKSNHSSRGRNIELVDNIQNVQNMDNGMKLVQKYIQNIWVLHQMTESQREKYPSVLNIVKKKFDIRFWVLVKSFSPLIIYVYNEAYLRISSQSYRLDALNEKNSHLTNFSVNWKSKQKSNETETSYLLFSNFLSFLKQQNSVDVSKLTKKIHNIILETLKLVDIKSDPRCFQIFGFDIILDAKFNPWILECNMSPACSPRGQLKNVVRQMTTGMFSILGLIQSSIYGWKLLYDEKRRTSKLINTCRVFKQTNQNFNNPNNTRASLSFPHEITLSGQKLKLKKYLKIQQIQYYFQKVTLIQRFLKNKRQSIKYEDKQIDKKSMKILLMLEVLAKLAKKAKKISWINLVPIKQRKFSKRKSKPI